MTKDDTLAKRIIRARAESGMSQAALAEAAGIAPSQISRYESGKNEPRPNVIAKIAEALRVPYSYLADGIWLEFSSEDFVKNEDGSVALSLSLDEETIEIAKKSAEIRGVSLHNYLKWLLVYGIKGPH